MKITDLTKENLIEWAGAIPKEIFVELMIENPRYHAAGVTFMNQVAGAVCWEENKSVWKLQSIYIFPECRRLGLGGELMDYLVDQMEERDCMKLVVNYQNEGERITLQPFLIYCGFEVDNLEMKLGRTNLQTVTERMKPFRLAKKIGTYSRISELEGIEKLICAEWVFKKLGEHLEEYVGEKPFSYVIINKMKVEGMLLLKEDQGIIRVDYFKVKERSVTRALPLLAVALEDLSRQYPVDTKLEMVLTNEKAENLYLRIAGEYMEKTNECLGEFYRV